MVVVQAFRPGKGGAGLSVLSSASALVCALLTVRGARCSTIIVRDGGVEYRSLARTRHWTWPEIEDFEARDSSEGVMQYRRRVLFVRERQGRVRKLQEINAAASRQPNPIDEIADRLNGLARR
jgi:Bacterial PH domain